MAAVNSLFRAGFIVNQERLLRLQSAYRLLKACFSADVVRIRLQGSFVRTLGFFVFPNCREVVSRTQMVP